MATCWAWLRGDAGMAGGDEGRQGGDEGRQGGDGEERRGTDGAAAVSVHEFRLPDLGEGLREAEVVRWFVGVGDSVEEDQPVVEVLTAKANTELPSPFAGTISRLYRKPGEVVRVGEALFAVRAEEGRVPAGEGERPLVGYGPPALAPHRSRSPVVSPVVRRLATELGVDLGEVKGSGPGGLVLRADVESAASAGSRGAGEQRGAAATAAAAGAAAVAARAGVAEVAAAGRPVGPGPQGLRGKASTRRAPFEGVHRLMAEQVARSRREIPEATLWVEVDASGLLRAREALVAASPGSPKVSVVAFLMRFCALGLCRWPALNGRVDKGALVLSKGVHVGFAAQTPSGLVVPVVHGAEALDLAGLDREVRRLSAAAREGRLRPADTTGGTFTVNNYGVFGIDGSAPIINYPEVAMLGVGHIAERPWVERGEVVARPVVQLALAFDHRATDGSVAAGFLRFVAGCLEEPARAL
jgi:2-oxoisovalerate dehydrogenase E2 component (dihydrolipoyl transacylase)